MPGDYIVFGDHSFETNMIKNLALESIVLLKKRISDPFER